MLRAINPTAALADTISEIRLLREHIEATKRRRASIYDAARWMAVRYSLTYARQWLADALSELDHDYDLARAQRTGRFA